MEKVTNGYFGKDIRSATKLGLFLRVAFFSFVMTLVFASVWFVNGFYAEGPVDFRKLLVVFLLVLVPAAASIVLSELPRGHDWVLVRLSLATFCRTGLPLFLAAVINHFSKRSLSREMLGFLLFFYLVAFLLSVSVSLSRLMQEPEIITDRDEVDGAHDNR